MSPDHSRFLSDDEIGILSSLETSQIQEIWLVRPRIYDEGRSDRVGFLQASAVLLRGKVGVFLFSSPRTMPTGYDELLIGVSRHCPNGDTPRALAARFGGNDPSLLSNALCRSARNHLSLVRARVPIGPVNASPRFIHVYDTGVHIQGAGGDELLLISHSGELETVEISSNLNDIKRELAGHTLLSLP